MGLISRVSSRTYRLMIHEIIKIKKTFTDESEAEIPDDLADMILENCSDFYKNSLWSLNVFTVSYRRKIFQKNSAAYKAIEKLRTVLFKKAPNMLTANETDTNNFRNRNCSQ